MTEVTRCDRCEAIVENSVKGWFLWSWCGDNAGGDIALCRDCHEKILAATRGAGIGVIKDEEVHERSAEAVLRRREDWAKGLNLHPIQRKFLEEFDKGRFLVQGHLAPSSGDFLVGLYDPKKAPVADFVAMNASEIARAFRVKPDDYGQGLGHWALPDAKGLEKALRECLVKGLKVLSKTPANPWSFGTIVDRPATDPDFEVKPALPEPARETSSADRPHACPLCGHAAYIGEREIDCSNCSGKGMR